MTYYTYRDKMKCCNSIIFSTIITLVITKVSSQAGNCQLSGVDDDAWQNGYFNPDKINDYVRGVVTVFDAENIDEISSQNGKYLTASLNADKTKVTISTSEAFDNFEENETKTYSSLSNVIVFTCTKGTSSLSYYQHVEDVNNHLPTFSSPEYVFNLAMPWPQLDLTLLLDVFVTDIDFKNTKIQFQIEDNDYVTIAFDPSKGDPKHYYAVITPKRSFRITDNITLQITSTDDQDVYGVQHTESAQIVLAVDLEKSTPPVPFFVQPSYQGQYTSENTIVLEDIEMDSGTYVDSIIVVLTGDFSDHFEVVNSNNIYSLNLKTPIESSNWPDLGYSELYLTATNPNADQPGRTVILLNFPILHDNTTTVTPSTITTSTDPGPPVELHFPDPQTNFFTKNESFLGVLITKTAIVVPSVEITYSINVTGNGNGRISIDAVTSEVNVDALLSPDFYNMTVFAKTVTETSFYTINLSVVKNDDSLYESLYEKNRTLILTNIILVVILASLIFGTISGFYYMARKMPTSYADQILSTKPSDSDDSSNDSKPTDGNSYDAPSKTDNKLPTVFLLPDNLVGSSNDVEDNNEAKARQANGTKRRKSVVTFNDTVEEIGISKL